MNISDVNGSYTVTSREDIVITSATKDLIAKELKSVSSKYGEIKITGKPDERKFIDTISAHGDVFLENVYAKDVKAKYGTLFARNCTFTGNVYAHNDIYFDNVHMTPDSEVYSEFGSGDFKNNCRLDKVKVFNSVTMDETSSAGSVKSKHGENNVINLHKDGDYPQDTHLSTAQPQQSVPSKPAFTPSTAPETPQPTTSNTATKSNLITSGIKILSGKVLLTENSIINNKKVTNENLSQILQEAGLKKNLINSSESPVQYYFEGKLVATWYKNIPLINPPAKPVDSTIRLTAFGPSTSSANRNGSSDLAEMCGLIKDNNGVRISYRSRNSEQPPTPDHLLELVTKTHRKGFDVLLDTSTVDIYLDKKYVQTYPVNLLPNKAQPEPDISAFNPYAAIKIKGLSGSNVYFDRQGTIGGVPVTRDNLAELVQKASEYNVTIINAPAVNYYFEGEKVFTWTAPQQQ